MILWISSLEIVNIVEPDPNIFFWIAASVAGAAGVNLNDIKTLLANGLSTILIKHHPVFRNGLRNLPKDLPDFPILCSWVFDNFMLAE